jgi:hypothetical protein
MTEMRFYRWSDIITELEKCDLLCENCHQELHDSNIENWSRNNKKLYLEYKGLKCEKCNYDKNQQSLSFHHIEPNKKVFSLREVKIKYVFELDNYIKNELDKCIVICRNCHNEEHIDKEKFELLKKQIYNKVNNFKEVQKKINKEEVYKLFDNGMKKVEISRYFNSARSTITDIIKNRK